MAKEPYVDIEECTSCDQCVDYLQEVLELDDDDLETVVDATGASEEKIQEEIDNCQGECIYWKE